MENQKIRHHSCVEIKKKNQKPTGRFDFGGLAPFQHVDDVIGSEIIGPRTIGGVAALVFHELDDFLRQRGQIDQIELILQRGCVQFKFQLKEDQTIYGFLGFTRAHFCFG